jgi:lipoprotein-anchoring transpeptidase ErfK/SrfK
MRRWIGLLGSWALFVLALGLASIAAAGEWINLRDSRRLDRMAMIEQMIAERTGGKADQLRGTEQQRAAELSALQQKVQNVSQSIDDKPDDAQQTIIVSTAENKLYLRRGGQVMFEALVSTGKGTRLAIDGKTKVFETPIGKFHIKKKEQDPQWVPPDWHYIEQADKNGMRVLRLNPGSTIDADTGELVSGRSDGVWSWLGGGRRLLRVKGNTVVEDDGGVERELPPGKEIVAGNTIVIPPVTTVQRHYAGVLGKYRLDLGDGYAIHGTDQPDKLGQAVSHGCVRVGDADIEKLYQIANVGDEVIIY